MPARDGTKVGRRVWIDVFEPRLQDNGMSHRPGTLSACLLCTCMYVRTYVDLTASHGHKLWRYPRSLAYSICAWTSRLAEPMLGPQEAVMAAHEVRRTPTYVVVYWCFFFRRMPAQLARV